jgi:hypothetical protein
MRFEGMTVTAVSICAACEISVLVRSYVCVCVWPSFPPEAGGLRSPCPFALYPVLCDDETSLFAPAAVGFPVSVQRATSIVQS